MIIALGTLTVIAIVSIGLGLAMNAGKPKYQPLPVAKYQKYTGANVNHLGEN